MKTEIKEKINNALEGLSQQQAYDIICEYKENFEKIYPMIEKKDEDVTQVDQERSFLDSVRLGEIIWIDKFTEILDDEGIELRDIDLHDKETQDRIETKLKQAIEDEDKNGS